MRDFTPTIIHIAANNTPSQDFSVVEKMSKWLKIHWVNFTLEELEPGLLESIDWSSVLILIDIRLSVAHVAEKFTQSPILALVHTPAQAAAAIGAGAADALAIDGLTPAEIERVFVARVSPWIERMRLRQRVSESDAEFRSLIHDNGDGILVIDTEGVIRFANPMAGALFAQSPAQLLGAYFGFPLVIGENTEIDIVSARGAHLTVEMRAVEVDWEGERAHLASLRDITARKLLDKERIEREKLAFALDKEREMRMLKERFLTMMSHELRTPLALIRLSHDMIRQYGERASAEERDQYLENISVQVKHMTSMIADVMAVSRAESAELDFEPDIIDLVHFCDTITREFHASTRMLNRIEFFSDQHWIRASVDVRLMRQAIINLLSNAVKFSPNGAPIEVHLSVSDHRAILSVRDHGIGVPPDDLNRIFEPFHRGSNIDTAPGAGLGLAIVAAAVKAHRGHVEVETRLGAGTTVTLILPVIIAAN